MWVRARKGEITDFTGVNDPFEEPSTPIKPYNIIVDGTENRQEFTIIEYLKKNALLSNTNK